MANFGESGGLPDEYLPQVQGINRQLKMADILRQQSQQTPQGQMVSGIYVAPSVTQHLANLLRGYQSGKMEKDAEQKQTDLYKGYQEKQTSAAQKLAEALNPKQVQTGETMPAYTPDQQDQFGSPLPNVQRQPVSQYQTQMPNPADIRKAQMEYAIQSGHPELLAQIANSTAEHAINRADKAEDWDKQITHEDALYNRGRADKLSDVDAERKYQDIVRKDQQGFQVSQQDRQFAQQFQMQKQAQGFQAGQNALSRAQQKELAGSNQPPIAVLGPDGKPQYVARQDAIGKHPYSAADEAKQTALNAKEETKKEGANIVDSNIALLRDAYDNLHKNGGIVSSKDGVMSNAGAKLSSSGLGQLVGGTVGSTNQTERDKIEQTRPLLLQSIMKATGMSAKQMDSNAELKLWLSTATDPTKSLEANKAALDNIERMYGSGAKGETNSQSSKKVYHYDAQGNLVQ